MLGLPCEVEYLLKNKDNAPELALIMEQRKAMEKADGLLKANKELERRIDYLTYDLQELKREKKIQQETFSQRFIVYSQDLEILREEKEGHKVNLEN